MFSNAFKKEDKLLGTSKNHPISIGIILGSVFCECPLQISAQMPGIRAFRPWLTQTCGEIQIGTGCILNS